MNIYLSGMIGTGKTTIGIKLAEKLNRPFYDLDKEMDKILGYSFHRLVEEDGWLAFRELEYSICKTFTEHTNAIIGLGGGTVRYKWNTDILKGSGIVILVDTPIEELIKRVSISDRPRVNPATTIQEDISLMWNSHKEKYYKSADIIFKTENKSLESEVNELKEIINGYS
jgi:shikimate kinase